jgi:hypothetical protein
VNIRTLRRSIAANVPAPVKAALKRRLNYIRLLGAELADVRRYRRYSTAFAPPSTRSQMRGHLVFDYHRIEKGLALPEPRPGFGRETILKLIRDLAAYRHEHGEDDLSDIVNSIFLEYREALDRSEISFPEVYAHIQKHLGSAGRGGTLLLTHDNLFAVPSEVARRFLASRRSIRAFTGEPVSRAAIEAVVELAQNAPSVCNRQSARIFCSNERTTIDRVLAHQNGNRGFGHLLGAVVIVTTDLEKFHSLGERNQPFVDGGIFAMSFVLALHAFGLGGCMLNWSVEPGTDRALREEFDIPESHVIITLIGCGHPVDPVRVAMSPRDPLADILHWL